MRKNSESKRFHGTGFVGGKQRMSTNRQPRNPQLESLEARQMLSAVSMTAAASDIQSEVFYVTLNNANNAQDTSLQYVAMHVQGQGIDAGDITVEDSAGRKLTVLNSKMEDGVTTLLFQMGMGSDYTVTVSGASANNPVSVLFTTPGDNIDGDGAVNSTEYYSAYGNVLKGQGVNQRAAAMFKAQYGIDVTQLQLDTLMDLDQDGKLSLSEFEKLVKGPFDSNLKIDQEITVKPEIGNIQVNRTDVTVSDEENNQFVAAQPGGEVLIQGQIPTDGSMTIQGKVTYEDVDGNEQTVTIDDMLQNDPENGYEVDANGNFILTLQNVGDNTEIKFEISYDGAENSKNEYSIQLDTAAPALVPGSMQLTSAVQNEKFTTDNKPNWTIVSETVTEEVWEQIKAEANDPADGIYLTVKCGDEIIHKVQLTAQKLEAGKKTDGNGNVWFEYAVEQPTALADGTYSFSAVVSDFIGNEGTAAESQEIVIDTVAPSVSSDFVGNYDENTKHKTDQTSASITMTVTDANQVEYAAVLNGENVTAEIAGGEYRFELAGLQYGENTFVFTVTDEAGNETTKEFVFIYNEPPYITEAGKAEDGNEYFFPITENNRLELNFNDLFAEKDGSSITKDSISVELNEAVASYTVSEDGTIAIIFDKDFGSKSILSTNVKISCTDEFGDSADADVQITATVTNNADAPVISFINKDEFYGLFNPEELITGAESTVKIQLSDNTITETGTADCIDKENTKVIVKVNGVEKEVDFSKLFSAEDGFTAEISCAELNLQDGDVVEIYYQTEDMFGVKSDEILLAELKADASIKGEPALTPSIASPSKGTPSLNVAVNWSDAAAAEDLKVEITYTAQLSDGSTAEGSFAAAQILGKGSSAIDFTRAEALADGTYCFTVTVTDNARNTKSVQITDYVIDATAPEISIEGEFVTAPEGTYDYYTNSGEIKFSAADNENGSGVKGISFNNAALEEITEKTFELTYGENTFTVTVEDNAGNKTTKTFVVYFNTKPALKADADMSLTLSTGALEEGKIKLNIADFIDDEAADKLTAGNVQITAKDELGAAVSSAVVEGNQIVLTMNDVQLGTDLGNIISLTVTDEFGETVELELDIKYTFDNKAPEITENSFKKDFPNTNFEKVENAFYSSSSNIVFTTQITDDTNIVSCGWKLVDAAGNTVASGSTAEVAISETLEDGEYRLISWGDDGVNPATTENAPSSTWTFVVDTTKPAVSDGFNVSVSDPGRSNSVTINAAGTVTDANDVWFIVYDNGKQVSIVKVNADGSVPEVTLTNLAEGGHDFTWNLVDAAGNKYAEDARTAGSVTINTAPYDISVEAEKTEIFVAFGTEENAKFTVSFSDNGAEAGCSVYYSMNGGEWTEYSAEDGISGLVYGENTFQFKVIDGDGNETVWGTEDGSEADSITVIYDHIPALTENTLPDKEFTYDAQANTISVTYSKAEIEGLFKDQDANDALKYSFQFSTQVEGLKYDGVSTADGYTLTFTVTPEAWNQIKALHNVGTLTVTAEDAYAQTAVSAAADISKVNLAPEQIRTEPFETVQKLENPSYSMDLSGYFADPESDSWTITEVTAENGTCVINGKEVTWTPAAGKYGNMTFTVRGQDASGAEFTGTVNLLVEWAGVTSVSAEAVTIEEDTAGTQNIILTIGNAFNEADAWGNYSAETEYSVAVQESVKGYVISDAGRTECVSLFKDGVTIENGVIAFELAENAYGTAVLTFTVNGTEGTVNLTVNNVPCAPNAPAQESDYQLSEEEISYDLLDKCDTGEDSGSLELSVAQPQITVEHNGKTYSFTAAVEDGQLVLARGSISGIAEPTDTDWEALDGATLEIVFVVTNTETGMTAESTLTVTFNSVAKSFKTDAERAQQEQTVEVNLSDLCDLNKNPGWKISNVTGGTDGVTAEVSADGTKVIITIPAGVYAEQEFSYTLAKDGEEKTYSSKISLTITDVNWNPEWNGVATQDGVYVEAQNEKDEAYSITVDGKFKDAFDNSALTLALKEGSVTITDARTGFSTTGTVTLENGVVTFSPEDKNFFGTVEFTISVTDEAIGDAPANTKDFQFRLTVNNVNDAPVLKEGEKLSIAGIPGQTLNLSALADKFEDPDGDMVTITTPDYKIPADAKIGINALEITVSDGHGTHTEIVSVLVNGKASQIKDQSLDTSVTVQNTYGPSLDDKGITLNETLTANANGIEVAEGTTLKAGTVLKAGTAFARGCEFTCSEELSWFADYGIEYEDGIYYASKITLESDITLEADITIGNATITLPSGSTISAGSFISQGSDIGQSLTVTETTASAVEIKKIYESLRVSDTEVREVLLKRELDITMDQTSIDKLTKTSKSVNLYDAEADGYFRSVTLENIVGVLPDGVENSPFRYITYENGKFYLYYTPYDITQNREARDMVISLGEDTVTVNVSIDYEKAFEVYYVLREGGQDQNDAQQADTIKKEGAVEIPTEGNLTLVAGQQYTIQLYARSLLPILAAELWTNGSPYGAQGFVEKVDVMLHGAENVQVYDKGDGANCSKYSDGKLTLETGVIGITAIELSRYLITRASFTATDNTWFGEFQRQVSNTCGVSMNNATMAGIGMAGGYIDASGYFVSGACYTDSSQVIITSFKPDAVKGATSAEQTVVQGNGVYMSMVTEKTDSEKTGFLTESVDYVTEWDSSWVELWVNTQEAGQDIANVRFDLSYDSSLFTATEIEYSSFIQNGLAAQIDAASGKVTGLGGDLTNAVTRNDGFVLVGRVKLESVGANGVAADAFNAASPDLKLENILMRNSIGSSMEVNMEVCVNTKVFAVVYDANDDGEININDLVFFARTFGQNTTEVTDAGVWAMDFNNSGNIDIQDLVSFARNYGKSRLGDMQVQYPANFFQTWIGTTLQTNGSVNIADTLEDAVDAWSEKLGEELNIDVQIIVKEYENVDGGILGETIILGTDEAGKPNSAVVYLDSDALGMGWFVNTSDDVPAEQYDLYSVLLHELGHALGMSNSYEGYRELIGTDGSYTAQDGTSYLVFGGHIYADNDLMNDTVDPGERLGISDIDAEIVSKSRENGGSVIPSAPDSACGSVSVQRTGAVSAPAPCALGTVETASAVVTAASGIMEETAWNEMLVDTAVKVVAAAENRLNDAAWEEMAEAENAVPETEPAAVEVDLFTAAVDSAIDDMFADEDFAAETDSLFEEPLNLKLNDEK